MHLAGELVVPVVSSFVLLHDREGSDLSLIFGNQHECALEVCFVVADGHNSHFVEFLKLFLLFILKTHHLNCVKHLVIVQELDVRNLSAYEDRHRVLVLIGEIHRNVLIVYALEKLFFVRFCIFVMLFPKLINVRGLQDVEFCNFFSLGSDIVFVFQACFKSSEKRIF